MAQSGHLVEALAESFFCAVAEGPAEDEGAPPAKELSLQPQQALAATRSGEKR